MGKTKNTVAAIDKGNGNTSGAAMTRPERFEHLKDLSGEAAIPSVIHFPVSGDPLFGFAAVNAERSDPDRTFRHFKRALEELGLDGKHPTIAVIDGKEYTAVDFTALSLAWCRREFEKQLGLKVKDVILTVPANFTNAGRKGMLRAMREAGFVRGRLLDEPVAAALAYGVQRDVEGKILIVDLGAGTLDTTLLEIAKGDFRALVTNGVSNLGGIDMENPIIRRAQEEYNRLTGKSVDLFTEPALLAPAREEAQRVKHVLSALPSTRFTAVLGGQAISFDISREDFEAMNRGLFDQIESCLDQTLIQAKIDGSELDRVLLVGGATNVPAVERIVATVTGKEPSKDIDRSLAVADGAAAYGPLANWDEDSSELLDTTPSTEPVKHHLGSKIKRLHLVSGHALGVASISSPSDPDPNHRILAMVCPDQATVGQTYTERFAPIRPLQHSVEIVVLQGKPDAVIGDTKTLGTFEIPITPRPTIEDRIEIAFTYTKNSTVKVTARDLDGGQTGHLDVLIG